MKKKPYKPSAKTLEKIVSYFDRNLHGPLSFDDMLYFRWRAYNEAFQRQLDQLRNRWREEWQREFDSRYLVKFSDGIYERGQVIKKGVTLEGKGSVE